MKIRFRIMALSLTVVSTMANAVVIDEATFKKNGGDVSNVPVSIQTANEKLRSTSFSSAWLSVGRLGGCTATWLGDKDGWRYLLTAAHCVPSDRLVSEVSGTFHAWNNLVAADGYGRAYLPQERVNIPAHLGDASTDIAIVRLPSRATMLDKAGRALEQPILNDSLDEKNRDVIFVGYGAWGVGINQDNEYAPAEGVRRLYGRSQLDHIFEAEHGLGSDYDQKGPSAHWAHLAPGDSGAAWWQIHNKLPVIVATTNGGHATLSTGARVSKYTAWIKSIYPEARFLSDAQPQGCIVSLTSGARYCLKIGERSPYSLPKWIYHHDVYVQADNGVSVMLSDWDNLSYARLALFNGTTENNKLKNVKADNGQFLDFSKPGSMRVVASTRPLGCIVSLNSGEKYCLGAEDRSGYALPAWIAGHDVFVEADSGVAVMLSDWDNLSYNRLAVFSGVVEHEKLKNVRAYNGEDLDFSHPNSMRVIQH
jgi:Beta/Gamma crystallin/Trypsin